MDEEIKRYREGLLTEIRADAAAGGDYERTRFIDRACQVLETGEEFSDYTICRAHTETRRRGQVRVDAFNFSPGDGVLNLIVAEYSGAEEPAPLITEELRWIVQAAYRFLEGSAHDNLADNWDESHPAHALSREVFSFAAEEMTKARIYLISDRPLGLQLGKIPELSLGRATVEVQTWDIARFSRAEASTSGREEIEINFHADYGQGIPALPASPDAESRYRSYMCVMPGAILAALYDRFGGRILEQNVRAFLGDGRKVNKGIRETLKNDPGMFFAFNNGLTVTVSELALERNGDGHQVITAAKGLQVVNGGQTTASLYWARKSGIDLSKVNVQMKLSKLPEEGFEDAVHDIARYANAQNAVSASDLFAGHPYFKRLEKLSRQTLVPQAKAGEVPGYWYFERTTGSYKVELKRKSGQAAKAWQIIHPKRQILTKTDVARYEVTFGCQPHTVSSGAQKNIAAFGKLITQTWSANPEYFDSDYFKRIVAQAILTRAVDAAIPAQPWYPGSIVRPLTSYVLALISERCTALGLQPDYEAIWRAQKAPVEFVEEAMRIASVLLPLIQEIPEEQVRNRLVTEWVKREACWTRIRESNVKLDRIKSILVPLRGPARSRESWPERARNLWREGTWKRLMEWNRGASVLTSDEADLVERAAITSDFAFRGFRLTKLEEAWKRALDYGFV